MAIVKITEYAAVDLIEGNEVVPALVWPPLATQTIDATSAAAGLTNPLNARTRYVRIHATAACVVVIAPDGSTPSTVATTAGEPFEANQPEIRRAPGNPAGLKVYAVAAS